MRRRIFSILSALSLVLCVVTAGLWLCTATGMIEGQRFPNLWEMRLDVGSHGIGVTQLILMPPHLASRGREGSAQREAWMRQHGAPVKVEGLGVAIGDADAVAQRTPREDQRVYIGMYRYLSLPYWLVIVATGVLPSAYLVSFELRRRRQRLAKGKGLCLKCGYDLRASKERCPECGTAIPLDSAGGCETKAL